MHESVRGSDYMSYSMSPELAKSLNETRGISYTRSTQQGIEVILVAKLAAKGRCTSYSAPHTSFTSLDWVKLHRGRLAKPSIFCLLEYVPCSEVLLQVSRLI